MVSRSINSSPDSRTDLPQLDISVMRSHFQNTLSLYTLYTPTAAFNIRSCFSPDMVSHLEDTIAFHMFFPFVGHLFRLHPGFAAEYFNRGEIILSSAWSHLAKPPLCHNSSSKGATMLS